MASSIYIDSTFDRLSMQEEQKIVPRSFGTHDGTFHADDVTACAMLLFVGHIDKDKIIRTRDMALLNRCEYVCDVGGTYEPELKHFDHHQVDYIGSLSSAGMVLEYLRTAKLLQPKEADFLNNSLVRGIDAHDNGKDPQLPGYCLFSHVISNFNPINYEASADELYAAYTSAVEFTVSHLHRLLERYRYNQSARGEVQKIMNSGKECLIFEHHIPWMDAFFELGGERHPAKFIIMPIGGQWKLRGIPPTNDDRMHVRTPLPAAWAGLMDKDLTSVSGIPDAVFCHKGRFISVWKTKEAALTAVERVFELLSKEKKGRSK
jgi:uncharacterized UPF0160 family protein